MSANTKKYARITTIIEGALNPDYSDPVRKPDDKTVMEFEYHRHVKREVLAVTGGTTIDLADFDTASDVGTIETAIVHNKAPIGGSDIIVVFENGSGAGQDVNIRPGRHAVLGDELVTTTDITLTTSGSDSPCEIEIFGSVA